MVRVYGEGYMWSFLGMGVWWVFFSVREIKPPSMAKPGGVGALITLSIREKMMLREYLSKLA
jgi:hypothetical protein